MVGMNNGADASRTEILLVDDERVLVDLLAFIVQQAGLVPLVATEPTGAIELFEREDPLVAVIDLNLKPWDGFELLADLRRRSATLPIIVLTARRSENDKVRALDMGADDYVVKPFGHRELLARIRAHARRAGSDRIKAPIPALEVGSFRLDPAERTLYLDGAPTRLTGTEFRLLQRCAGTRCRPRHRPPTPSQDRRRRRATALHTHRSRRRTSSSSRLNVDRVTAACCNAIVPCGARIAMAMFRCINGQRPLPAVS